MNRYNALAKIQSADEQREMLQDSVHQTEMIYERKETVKKKWMAPETMHLIDKIRYKKEKEKCNNIDQEI